jgi:cellulose synthase/poly-beta-1,6-N-acetylglucosamine synthase-like glycosyltransferase
VTTILVASQVALVAFFVVSNLFQSVLVLSAFGEMVRHRRTVWGQRNRYLLDSPLTPRISVLAPAYNEAETVAASVRSLLTLSYPDLEVVVVNDGSTDRTLDVLTAEFHLQPVTPSWPQTVGTRPVRGLYRSPGHRGLVVVDKENGGKADALNAGINVATGELLCAIDADTLIEPEALLRVVRPFLTDDGTVAAGGSIRVVNGSVVRAGRVVEARLSRRLLPGIQTVEYLRAYLVGRLGWNRLGGNLIVSGAFGLFRRSAVLAAGGYRHDTVGEDMELVVRLRRTGLLTGTASRVMFVPDPIAWTEVPGSLRVLGRQRDRWQRGLADVVRRHHDVALRPRYRTLGMIGMPYFMTVELVGPVIEVLGLLGLVVGLLTGVVDASVALAVALLGYGWGVLLTSAAVLLHQWSSTDAFRAGDLPRLLLYAVAENIGYRQLNLAWRVRGLWRFLRGRTEWGLMTRVGFEQQLTP